MEFIDRILVALQGRKTSIGTILALFITLALTRGWIDNDLAIFFNGVLVALGIGANYADIGLGHRARMRAANK